ncbi:ribonuclease P protein subunit [Candidatus Micrarchaeota archaeon]|nr:ribonuclease P protein subunit [Candidatus Micrarchaeota archaeon]
MRCAQNLALHELLGTNAKVASSQSNPFVGLSGMVVDETKNTLVLETQGRQVRIPKKGCTFVFTYEGRKTKVEGAQIAFRSEDRTKKARMKPFKNAKRR